MGKKMNDQDNLSFNKNIAKFIIKNNLPISIFGDDTGDFSKLLREINSTVKLKSKSWFHNKIKVTELSDTTEIVNKLIKESEFNTSIIVEF